MGLRLFLKLNGDLLLAALIAGAIQAPPPTNWIISCVRGTVLNRVVVASAVAVPAHVCTCAEVPMALALMSKGMGHGATLACLLGGPRLSLPSIAMLAGVFRPRVWVLFAGVSFAGCVVAGYEFNLSL